MESHLDNDDFGTEMPSFFEKWFAFIMVLMLAGFVGTATVIYLLLVHFGVIA